MRGRKSDSDNVVPLTDDARTEDHAAAGQARADDLKPGWLDEDTSKAWERIAPHLCNPLKNRLHEHMVEPFVLMLKALVRFERLDAIMNDFNHPDYLGGETYRVSGRNGDQHKPRPEVIQRGLAFTQFVTLARDFGLTPAAERGLQSTGQGSLPFGEDDFT